MKREELKAYDGESIYRVLECTPHNDDDELHLEACFNNNSEFKFYKKAEADKVMAAYEQRIDDLEDKDRLLKIISMFNGDMREMGERIKELETSKSFLLRKVQEYMEDTTRLKKQNECLREQVHGWHVVADGDLPKIGETVLTSNTHGAMNYASFVGTHNEKTMWLYHDVQFLDEIMYWCAIPKPSTKKETPNEA